MSLFVCQWFSPFHLPGFILLNEKSWNLLFNKKDSCLFFFSFNSSDNLVFTESTFQFYVRNTLHQPFPYKSILSSLLKILFRISSDIQLCGTSLQLHLFSHWISLQVPFAYTAKLKEFTIWNFIICSAEI